MAFEPDQRHDRRVCPRPVIGSLRLPATRAIARRTAPFAVALLAASLLSQPARADKPLQLYDGADGVTCELFNRAGSLRGQTAMVRSADSPKRYTV